MAMRRFPATWLFAAACAAALVGAVASAQTPTPAATPAKAAAAASGPTACADCHGDQVKAFASNPHLIAQIKGRSRPLDPEAVCATCHGDGTKHMEAGGDASLIHGLKGLPGSQDCVTCHSDRKNPHDSTAMGFHANTAAVNCLSCHSIHKAVPKSTHLLANEPGKLCATCHLPETASFQNKPYAHRLDRGGMTCLDCHDPHARGGQVVKMTVQGELPCLSCHADLRGPFVFQHVVGSGGDCLSCHQPHGSNNPNMLLWARVDQLCLSCHSQTGGPKTYGSQPPSFHDLTLPRYRNCTTCHVAVHGSNLSPQLLK